MCNLSRATLRRSEHGLKLGSGDTLTERRYSASRGDLFVDVDGRTACTPLIVGPLTMYVLKNFRFMSLTAIVNSPWTRNTSSSKNEAVGITEHVQV